MTTTTNWTTSKNDLMKWINETFKVHINIEFKAKHYLIRSTWYRVYILLNF